MSTSVSVLAPNGRRQTVKCTPNTTILQIIEDVCKKQGYKAEEYDVKHHNKILDATTTFRFSGLPNNAQLELVPATKTRTDSDVILAVNLEDGSRLMGNFHPDETLWNILTKLCPDEIISNQNVIIIYTRNEIYGEGLQKTTLRSLGLRGGRAMIRLIHKAPEELKTQANISAPIPPKPAEEKPYRRTLKSSGGEPTDVPMVESDTQIDKSQPPIQKQNEIDFLKLAREKRRLGSNQAQAAENESQIPKSKPKIESQLKEEAMEVDISPEKNKAEEIPVEDDNFIFLGSRNAMLFSLESARIIPSDDLPDDFFELTIDDAKKIVADIKRKRHDMENGMLMTSAMRELEESKKQLRQLNKYRQSIIRVQFSDQTVLQGTFQPTETVQDVVQFVREYLEDVSLDIYLYTTPPKSILLEESRLIEVGCVPGALLHIGTNVIDGDIKLKTELQDKFTTSSLASKAASKMRRKNTRDVPEDSMEQSSSMDIVPDSDQAGPSSQPTNYERKLIKSSEKVPKWFKPCK